MLNHNPHIKMPKARKARPAEFRVEHQPAPGALDCYRLDLMARVLMNNGPTQYTDEARAAALGRAPEQKKKRVPSGFQEVDDRKDTNADSPQDY